MTSEQRQTASWVEATTPLQRVVFALAAEHPDWGQRQVAKEAGCTQGAVSKIMRPEARRKYNAYDVQHDPNRVRRGAWERRRASASRTESQRG